MDLHRISAVVRPRSAWEAIDLGFVMARQWLKPIYAGWFAVTLPVFLLLQLFLWEYGALSAFIIWWFKPLWERVILHYISRRLFGEEANWKQQLRNFWRIVPAQWWQSVTFRRFSFTRSFDLPVVQLEGLSGEARRRRLDVLHRSDTNGAVWLTIVLLHFEMIFTIGAYSTLYLFIPQEVNVEWWDLLVADSSDLTLFSNIAEYLAISLIAPFYVAGGFSLYLNRRTQLEGWDIEITFRQLAQRTQRNRPTYVPGSTANGALLGILLFAGGFLLTGVGWQASAVAEDTVVESSTVTDSDVGSEIQIQDKAAAKLAIEAILASDTFHQKDIRKYPKFVLDWEFQEAIDDPETPLPDWLVSLLSWIANSVEVIIWAFVAALALLLLYYYRDWLVRFAGVRTKQGEDDETLPSHLFGLEVSAESFSDNPAAVAQQLWLGGKHREAMSLLYRATLSKLMHHHKIDFHSSYTEGECERLVAAQLSTPVADYFSRMTHCWVLLAYAEKVPADAEMQGLFQSWVPIIGSEQLTTAEEVSFEENESSEASDREQD